MGHGIAYMLAAAGHNVRVHDPDAAALALLPERLSAIARLLGADEDSAARVGASTDIGEVVANAQLVIEAAPEQLDLKQRIFAQLDTLAPADAILASNTSAIPIAQLSEPVRDKRRVIGAHFWNPPHLVRLVELIESAPGSDVAIATVMSVLARAGWTPVHVKRDIPGFVGNRMQHALKREAIALVAAGVCDAETIDTVVKIGFGSRLAVLGPLEQSDMVGLDLTKSIHDVLLPSLDVTPHTQPYLDTLIEAGSLGMRTGRGFREWTPEQADAVRQRLDSFLAAQAQRLATERQP